MDWAGVDANLRRRCLSALLDAVNMPHVPYE